MACNWLNEAKKISSWIKGNRIYLHEHPELGDEEFETASYIEKQLKLLFLRIQRPFGTAVVAYLDIDKNAPTVALRSDIDALPITEETGVSFASLNPGCMHACGHDVHMSSLLGAARILSEHKNELQGNVKFIFEPSEERRGGAKKLVDLGVMEGVEAAFGMHVAPDLEYGDLGVRYGKFYAASDEFAIYITGKTAHGAQPQNGIDALLTGARIVSKLHDLPKKLLPDKSVVTIGIFESGTADNILSGKAKLAGICRTLGSDDRFYLEKLLRKCVLDECFQTGARAEIKLIHGSGGIVNTEKETRIAEEAASKLLGQEHVIRIKEPLMISEDFGCYIDAAAGSFYHLGVGKTASLHSPFFLPSEDSPVLGAAVHAQIVTEYLKLIQTQRI